MDTILPLKLRFIPRKTGGIDIYRLIKYENLWLYPRPMLFICHLSPITILVIVSNCLQLAFLASLSLLQFILL